MKEDLENKIKGIVGLYSFYKHQMNTPQRIALLTLWIETCVNREEYEVANALQIEMDKILKGDEDYHLMAPTTIMGLHEFIPPTSAELKERIVLSMDTKPIKVEPTPIVKKKLKFANYWGTGSFQVFNLTFGDFKIIFLNVGFEMK